MKKKLLILVVLIIGMYFGYRYLYHEHRDIAKEEAAFALKVPALLKEFEADETKANTKYLDKPVLINSRATSSILFLQAHINAVSPLLLTWSGLDNPVLINSRATFSILL